jgi:hypothetical protein
MKTPILRHKDEIILIMNQGAKHGAYVYLPSKSTKG